MITHDDISKTLHQVFPYSPYLNNYLQLRALANIYNTMVIVMVLIIVGEELLATTILVKILFLAPLHPMINYASENGSHASHCGSMPKPIAHFQDHF